LADNQGARGAWRCRRQARGELAPSHPALTEHQFNKNDEEWISMKKTDMARLSFNYAWSCIARSKGDPQDVLNCLGSMTQGQEAMALALRETYIKLEEIEALIKKQNAPH